MKELRFVEELERYEETTVANRGAPRKIKVADSGVEAAKMG